MRILYDSDDEEELGIGGSEDQIIDCLLFMYQGGEVVFRQQRGVAIPCS